MSKKAFCKQQDIKAPTFYYWQRQLEEIKSPPEERFYRMLPKQNTKIVVCLPDKEIKLRSDCAGSLAQVIKHLCSA